MPQFDNYPAFIKAVERAASTGGTELETLWEKLQKDQQVPFTDGEQVAFLFRGEAFAVAWCGDFNRWRIDDRSRGKRLGDSDIWLLEKNFPADARIDYKIVVDDETWLLDPANSRIQWSGHGPNSVLLMPEYKESPYPLRREHTPAGTLSETRIFNSHELGYEVAYTVYVPPVEDLNSLPVIYATDGHEYADERLGALPTVLDNLLAECRIEPVLAVFIDPRTPSDLQDNRRHIQYVQNERFAAFLAQELVPLIEGLYPVRSQADARLILGTALGGLNAAYVAARYPDVFGLVAMQSPAFWVSRGIYRVYESQPRMPLKIYLSSGRGEWDEDIGQMRAILESKDYPMQALQVNEGHSWGQWRGHLADLVTWFFHT